MLFLELSLFEKLGEVVFYFGFVILFVDLYVIYIILMRINLFFLYSQYDLELILCVLRFLMLKFDMVDILELIDLMNIGLECCLEFYLMLFFKFYVFLL